MSDADKRALINEFAQLDPDQRNAFFDALGDSPERSFFLRLDLELAKAESQQMAEPAAQNGAFYTRMLADFRSMNRHQRAAILGVCDEFETRMPGISERLRQLAAELDGGRPALVL